MVTDPKGEKVNGDVEGFKKALGLLKQGKPVSFQGATGALVFDKNGDVSAPAVLGRSARTESTRSATSRSRKWKHSSPR